MTETSQLIEQVLSDTFSPSYLQIIDQSHLHQGHRGQIESGGGHFVVKISAAQFANKKPVQCHKMIYGALGSLMNQHIHALSIKIIPVHSE